MRVQNAASTTRPSRRLQDPRPRPPAATASGTPAIAAYRQVGRRHRTGLFADNHEGWGEILLARGDAAGAIAKFQEAQKTAPRWARLHLKWGEALVKLGKRDEARAQFKAAATMDLTADERAELAAQKV